MAQDDFDAASLAAYLHLTPDQVRKMADRNKLPGRRIGGEWRFSRAEIHHWFEQQIGISGEQKLVEVEKVLGRQHEASAATAISELVSEPNIAIPLVARTKRSVISRMCQLAADAGLLWDESKMVEAIHNREELHPTALENGVALLHPRRPLTGVIGEPFVALGVTTSGIPFGGPRGVLTDVFFLIASISEAQHLQTLARLSRIIQIPDFLHELRECEDSAAAMALIANADLDLT